MAKAKLEIGETIRSATHGGTYKVVKVLNRHGAEGAVYSVADNVSGRSDRALKWYWKSDASQKEAIRSMIANGSPNALKSLSGAKFIWPIDFVQNSQSFGYVMEYIDTSQLFNYERVVHFNGSKGKVLDHNSLCIICNNLLRAFQALHASGYCYKDISKNNVNFDEHGNVIIFDPDNIRLNDPAQFDPRSTNPNILGSPPFIAPEIYAGTRNPNTYTDLWQLAYMFFLLWAKSHPYDGQLTDIDPLLYSRDEPRILAHQFIFDKKTKNYIGNNLDGYQWENYCWHMTPEPLKQLFSKAFIDGADPDKRVSILAWKQAFDSVQQNLGVCQSCSAKIYQGTSECICCGAKMLPAPVRPSRPKSKALAPVRTKAGELSVFENNKKTKTISFRLGTKLSGAEVSNTLSSYSSFAEVGQNPAKPEVLGLKNTSGCRWICKRVIGKDSSSKRVYSSPFEIDPGRSMVLRNSDQIVLRTAAGEIGIRVVLQ